MLVLKRNARVILTDSGGIQKEVYFFAVPCVALREETEWVEIVEVGWNVLAGVDEGWTMEVVEDSAPVATCPDSFGDGRAAARFVGLLEEAG
jgi:UDP-N-acetylglucosamine 2-epimerase